MLIRSFLREDSSKQWVNQDYASELYMSHGRIWSFAFASVVVIPIHLISEAKEVNPSYYLLRYRDHKVPNF